jgi:SAM-dependent methyltransferase
MDLLDSLSDAVVRVARRLGAPTPDYREILFHELQQRLGGACPTRVLEVGPRDGEDTRRLLSLSPEKLVLVDLPDKEERVRQWLDAMQVSNVELIIGNIMYDRQCEELEPFDLLWCTGVLYHNPEQLRMIRRLFDMLKPGGILILESATARRRHLRDDVCVEIWNGIDKAEHRRHHVSTNVTHLPSRLAIKGWMEMVGFKDIQLSHSHSKVLRQLRKTRAAFIARKPGENANAQSSTYYHIAGLDYAIGKST